MVVLTTIAVSPQTQPGVFNSTVLIAAIDGVWSPKRTTAKVAATTSANTPRLDMKFPSSCLIYTIAITITLTTNSEKSSLFLCQRSSATKTRRHEEQKVRTLEDQMIREFLISFSTSYLLNFFLGVFVAELFPIIFLTFPFGLDKNAQFFFHNWKRR